MNYLYFETFTIISLLSCEEVLDRIRHHIETETVFKGQVSDSHFKITRITNYRNGFLPVVEGSIYSNETGSKVNITMRLSKFVMGSWVIWIIISLFIFIGLISKFGMLNFRSFIPLLALMFIYLVSVILFNFEAKKAKRLLETMLR